MLKKIKKLLLTVFVLNFIFLSIQPMVNDRFQDINVDHFHNDIHYDSSSCRSDSESDVGSDIYSGFALETDICTSNEVINKYYIRILHMIQNNDFESYASLIEKVEGLGILEHIVEKTNDSDDASFINIACGMCIDGVPDIKIIESLFWMGVDFEHTNINCATPLILLVGLFYNYESILLIPNLVDILSFMLGVVGVDPNIKDVSGQFALLRASLLFGRYAMVKELLFYGADPNMQDNYGDTAFHNAVRSPYLSWVKTVRILLKNCADPTIRNNKGKTPLHLILEQLDMPILIMFLTGIIKTGDIFFVKDVSSYLGLVEMIRLILSTGIDLNQLIDLEYLEGKLSLVFGRDIDIDDFVNIFNNYEKIFVKISNEYGLLPRKVRVANCSVEKLRRYLSRFYKLKI